MNTKIVPRGIRNNNPLNIVKGNSWQGERHPQTDRRFEEFTSIEFGIRAGLKLIRNYISGGTSGLVRYNTIRKIVSKWAPPSENATERYVQQVAQETHLHPDETIDPNDRKKICAIAQAMAWVECGQRLNDQLFLSAWDLI